MNTSEIQETQSWQNLMNFTACIFNCKPCLFPALKMQHLRVQIMVVILHNLPHPICVWWHPRKVKRKPNDRTTWSDFLLVLWEYRSSQRRDSQLSTLPIQAASHNTQGVWRQTFKTSMSYRNNYITRNMHIKLSFPIYLGIKKGNKCLKIWFPHSVHPFPQHKQAVIRKPHAATLHTSIYLSASHLPISIQVHIINALCSQPPLIHVYL